ncbi:MAG: metallophosphoesterase [Planctomycetes bacterium]|nr:metallophosphoesterase [Planctomycetota bacterium]
MPIPKRPTGKFRRAKARHLLFTSGPNKLSRGRLYKKHLDQSIALNSVEIVSPLWPKAFDGLRIGHVSDFHLGDLMPLERANHAIQLLANQEPDIVVCTGDVVDLHVDKALPLLESLVSINAPLGTMLVLGNHDELDCATTIGSMAINAGITLLRDASCCVRVNGEPFNISGIDWAKSSKRCNQKVERVCDSETHLLLSHNPKAFKQASRMNIPLTLSGHTHGGQMALRNKKGANLALSHRFSAGTYERGDSRLFVTVGVGAWFPLRVNCPAEVAILTVGST